MTTEESSDSEQDDLREIPEEWQDISTEEIIEADYEVVPPSAGERSVDEAESRRHGHVPVEPLMHPGSVDSVDASSENCGGDRSDAFDTGHEMASATGVGHPDLDAEYDADLQKLNDGRHPSDGNHSTRESQRDKKRIAEAICSALPLARHEREKVVHVVKGLDLTQFGHQKAIARVTLGVVTVVVDEQLRHIGYNPEKIDLEDLELVRQSDAFRSICKKHDISMSDLSTIKQTVRDAIDEGAVRPKPLDWARDPDLPDPTPPEDFPDIYWNERPPEHWASVAQHWAAVPDDYKNAIPEKYRDLVDRLRNWAPWEDDTDEQSDDQTRPEVREDEEREFDLEILLNDSGPAVEDLLDEFEDVVSSADEDESNK